MSTHASTVIDQKAYLKKYLSGDTTKKKKHKKDKKHKVKVGDVKVKIIDDDVGAGDNDNIDEELLLVGDDAPQIVGEYVEEQADTKKWRSIAVKEESPDEEKIRIKQEPDDSDRWGRRENNSNFSELPERRLKIKQEPNRSRSRSLDQSPPRRQHNQSPPRRKRRDSDQSPQRRKRRDSDQSPPRRKRRDSDQSPPRRKGRDSDQSPPRRKRRDSDQNPPRMKRRDSDQSPPRRKPRNESPLRPKRRDSDQSSPRRNTRSPPKRSRSSASRDQSPTNLRSPTRRRSRWEQRTAARSPSPPPTHKPKTEKTLDGKKAGLQDAQSLRAETDERRRKEDRIFAQMSGDVSGRNAEVAVRSTGRRGQRARDAAAEDPEVQRRKAEHEQKKRELYDRWGKGLKQIEDHRARMEEQEYEGSKPLARYSNDEDLERHLREQERADDPMLEYMRQKKKHRDIKAKVLSVPVYQGSYPDNRFGIRPGYRWDGVDRSNGYEAKWLSRENEQRALQDEAYKYMVEDM